LKPRQRLNYLDALVLNIVQLALLPVVVAVKNPDYGWGAGAEDAVKLNHEFTRFPGVVKKTRRDRMVRVEDVLGLDPNLR